VESLIPLFGAAIPIGRICQSGIIDSTFWSCDPHREDLPEWNH
jgi:hypothetical protein